MGKSSGTTFQIYLPAADVYYVAPKDGRIAYHVSSTAAGATQFTSIEDANAEIEAMGFHHSTRADDQFAAFVSSVPVG